MQEATPLLKNSSQLVLGSRRYPGNRQRFGQRIIIESEGITENIRSLRTDVMSAINAAVPTDEIMSVLKHF
jgi:hypothetical protein